MSEFSDFNDSKAEESVDTESVKCPSCGSNMVFQPESQMLYCEHCGTKQSFAQDNQAEELDIKTALLAGREWSSDSTVVFACENCNAKVVLQKSETAKTCPFCGTAHVKKTDELAGLKPNALIPFSFGDEKALELSKAWARKRFFAPRDFKKRLNADNLKGVYAPSFTFDSQTVSYYEGKIGITRTRTVGSGKNRRVQTYVVWRYIRGTYNSFYDDVLITSGSKFSQAELNKISPFDTNGGKVYEENYLLGFMAYHYDKELTDCWQSAKNVIDQSIRRGILSQYHHDRVAYLNVSTTHSDVTYKYVMLPVYVGNFNYKKKLYNFYVNGSTGKVCGKTPKSVWKILGTLIISIAIVVGAYFLFTLL